MEKYMVFIDEKYDQTTSFKNIKSIKLKKMLLNDYIQKFNEQIYDEITKQKNKLLLKSLLINFKYIDEDNIVLEDNSIVYIKGLYVENNLLRISNIIYKKQKIPK